MCIKTTSVITMQKKNQEKLDNNQNIWILITPVLNRKCQKLSLKINQQWNWILKPIEYIQSYTHRQIHGPKFFLKDQKAKNNPTYIMKAERNFV